jgi:selenocysteine-specific elongation factor
LKAAIAAMLSEHHRAQPLSDGIPREEARERLLGRGQAAVFERALEELSTAGTIVVRDRIALAGHRVALSPEEERARQAIERIVRDADLKPPDPASLAAAAGVSPMIVDRMIKLLLRQKVLVKIDTLVFHEEALRRLKAAVTSLKAGGPAPGIDVATFKERFGVTRKFAIPLLEYLDRERVTRRVGDARIVL